MARLLIHRKQKFIKGFSFTEGIRIGRNECNDLVLDFAEISREHASIVQNPDGKYVLRNLANRNVVTLGGKKIGRCILSFGDTFQIGDLFFTFLED